VIRVGLAGYGLAGSAFHAPLIRAVERMELTAVLTSRDALQRVDSFDELLERSDLVVVATPNTTHFDLASAALTAGKHVVVDKPLTVTVDEADKLIGLAEQCERVLTVFHNRRWDGDFLTVRKIMPELGEISLFEACWDRFRPKIKRGWREAPAAGSGVLADLGPHMIDQALQLFGWPDAISADVAAQRSGAQVDDYFDLTLYYGSARACLRCSTLTAEPRPRFAVHGSRGSFVKHGLDAQETALKAGVDPRAPDFGIDTREGSLTVAGASTQPMRTERGRYLSFYDGVAEAILEGAPAPVDPRDARDGLALIDLARQGSATGRALPVPAASSKEAPTRSA